MPRVLVELPAVKAHSYPIEIRPGLLARAPGMIDKLAGKRRVAVISDSTVARLYGRPLTEALKQKRPDTRLLRFPAGERHKTRATKDKLEDRLLGAGYGRDSLLVAVGGGVVGDLVGFVAATLHRGVPFVQVPTTLLAMSDSAVGGKTAVDTPAGKNLIGAFWQPEAVIVDPEVLGTLPARETRAGAAEVVKHGIIADAKLFRYMEKNLEKLPAADPKVIARGVADSCRIKAAVVSKDEREGGYRQILNFGHTIAHALELVRNFKLLHGEAVWVGMAVEAALAEEIGLLSSSDAARIVEICNRVYPAARALRSVSVAALLKAAKGDKKARAGKVRYSLPARIGAMSQGEGNWSLAPDPAAVRRALARLGAGQKSK